MVTYKQSFKLWAEICKYIILFSLITATFIGAANCLNEASDALAILGGILILFGILLIILTIKWFIGTVKKFVDFIDEKTKEEL